MPTKRSPHAVIHDHAFDFWLARGAVLVIAGLQMLFVNNNLVFGPKWMNPLLKLAILAPLSVATAWTQRRARVATKDQHWIQIARYRRLIRLAALPTKLAVRISSRPSPSQSTM